MKNKDKEPTNFTPEEIPSVLPVVPTIDVVVFPQMVVPLLILDEKIIKGVEKALEGDKKIFLLAARQPQGDFQSPISISDLYEVGTVGNIMRIMRLPDEGIKILIQGVAKAHVEEILADNDELSVKIKPFEQEDKKDKKEQTEKEKEEQKALVTQEIQKLLGVVEKIAASGRVFGPDFQVILSQIEDPERVADFILSHLNLTVDQAQSLLETTSIQDLLRSIHEYLNKEVVVKDVEDKIRSHARDSMNQSQKEYYLREQMKAIQKELGDDGEQELEEFRKKLQTLPLPEEVRIEGTKEFKRLGRTAAESMEATVIRNHLEWLLGLPWGKHTKDNLDIAHAQKVLDEYHYGLDEIKDRILDYLSIKALKEDCHVPILCFAGPPGVGKTSLGKAIAESLGRNYYRISLGGVYDESEIRGHRRTYVGALPGRFIQGIRKSGSMNPLIVIDEIDKIGMSNRGDPSAALLEILDPEQNNTFYDNYLGVHFDLSKCMFVTTANDLATVPQPLRDRMEIIHLSGYTTEDKQEIAKNHLIKKAINNAGLEKHNVVIDKKTVEEVIGGYTRESGVRELDRLLHKLCSKYARSLVEKKKELVFTSDNLEGLLGPRKIPKEHLIKANKVGVSNGLAWTPFGGEILQVEAALMPGSGKLILTGQLGSVMKESAQAALTYVRAHADLFGVEKKKFADFDVHIHLPAGAIPKDGPSAGITLLSSLLSAFTGRAVSGNYAMTGELNLQGDVLPIGGLKEKMLAAKQNGLSNVIIPKLNQKDLKGLDKISKGMNIVLVDNVQEVVKHVLLKS